MYHVSFENQLLRTQSDLYVEAFHGTENCVIVKIKVGRNNENSVRTASRIASKFVLKDIMHF